MKRIFLLVIPIIIISLLGAGGISIISFRQAHIRKFEIEKREKYEQELSILSAENLIKESIRCRNEHNIMKYNLTHVPDLRKGNEDIYNTLSCEILNIKEIDVEEFRKATYAYVYDIKRFSVDYEIKWKNEKTAPYRSGEFTWTYTLIKPNENDRWYIATCGF